MDRGKLQIWFAYPGDVASEEVARKCAGVLSSDERSRMERFRSDQSRRQYLVAHALARTALSHLHPVAPEAWRFCSNSYGKPHLEPECGIRFNLSHSRGLAVCLISTQVEVGVDTEKSERGSEILEIAQSVFSPLELAQLEKLGSAEALDRALSLWTLKEAYIKARGMGLTLPLRKFSFIFDGVEGIRLELDVSFGDDARRWQFCLLDHAAHRVALVTERTKDTQVELWEMRPVLAVPRQLAEFEPAWYPIVQASR